MINGFRKYFFAVIGIPDSDGVSTVPQTIHAVAVTGVGNVIAVAADGAGPYQIIVRLTAREGDEEEAVLTAVAAGIHAVDGGHQLNGGLYHHAVLDGTMLGVVGILHRDDIAPVGFQVADGGSRSIRVGHGIHPAVEITGSRQAAGYCGGGGTVVGTVALLRFGGDLYMQRLRNGDSQGIGVGAAVFDGGVQDSLGSLVSNTITMIARFPRIGFAASGIAHHCRSRVVDQQFDVFLLIAAGSHQYRMTAVIEGDVRVIVHIECIVVATPSHGIVIGIDSEIMLHVCHLLTGGQEDGGGGKEGGIEDVQALESRIGTVGIDPVFRAEEALQGVASHSVGGSRDRLVAVVLECGEHTAHLVVVGHGRDVGSGAVTCDTAHIGAGGRYLTRIVALVEVIAGFASHAAHFVGGAGSCDIAGIVCVGEGSGVFAHHAAEIGSTVHIPHIEAEGERVGIHAAEAAHIVGTVGGGAAVAVGNIACIHARDGAHGVGAGHDAVFHKAAVDLTGIVARDSTHDSVVVGGGDVGILYDEVVDTTRIVSEEAGGVGCTGIQI